MKHTFTFIVFMVVATLLTFGQSADFKNLEKYNNASLKRHLQGLKPDDKPNQRGFLFPRNRNIVQGLKSAQTIKQRLDSTVFQAWNDTTKLWKAYSKRVYTYNASGKNTEYHGYVWVAATNKWIPDWKYEYSYNESGSVTQYLGYDWDKENNNWISDWKNEYSYDANGTVPQILDYEWDKTTNKWVLAWQYLYSYNENGDLTQILDYYLDEASSQWVLAWKYDWLYDANGHLSQEIEYYLYENTSQWTVESKAEYIFDENGNNTKYLAYYTNETTGQLELDFKREFTYDNRYTFDDLISPLLYLWQVNLFNHMLTQQSNSLWNKSTSEWETPIYKASYYYSEQNTTSVTGLNQNQFKVYPNPVTEYIQFDFASAGSPSKFELFDLQGRKVFSENVLNGQKLDVQELTSGVYFYTIITNGTRQTGKFIKQ